MVAILEKGEFNTDFLLMVDFIAASPLRRNLKLRDEDEIVSIPDTELFENLTLIGYNISQNQKFTFQKGQFSHQWKYLIHTIMQCLSPKSIEFNEFSSNIAIALVCLATNMTYNFSKMIFDGMVNSPSFSGKIVPLFDTMLVHQGEGSSIPTEPYHTPSLEADKSHPTTSSIPLPSLSTAPIPLVTQTDTTPIRQYSRRARIAQSFTLPTVADEAASPVRDVSKGEASPRVTSPAADEGSMQQTISKLTALCTSLQRQHSELLAKFQAQEVAILRLKERVQVLEDRGSVTAKQSGDDAPIKGRSINEGEAAAKRISNDSEEIARVLTSMDAATFLAGGIDVPTGSGSIPTAGPPAADISTGSEVVSTASAADISTGSEVVPTASLIVTSYSRHLVFTWF
nr:synaptobrevin, longin-like domain protein [Tanacetum cinerariifolium]